MKISQMQQKLGGLFICDPEKELGPNYETVLNFWLFLETLSADQVSIIAERYNESERVHGFHMDHTCKQVEKVILNEEELWLRIFDHIYFTGTTFKIAISWATHELIAMHEFIANGEQIRIIPLFDCANCETGP
jgi:hypothetical protein